MDGLSRAEFLRFRAAEAVRYRQRMGRGGLLKSGGRMAGVKWASINRRVAKMQVRVAPQMATIRVT